MGLMELFRKDVKSSDYCLPKRREVTTEETHREAEHVKTETQTGAGQLSAVKWQDLRILGNLGGGRSDASSQPTVEACRGAACSGPDL